VRVEHAQSLLALARDTNCLAPSSRRLCVLSANADAPVVPETAMVADSLEALEVVAELGVDAVGEDLGVLAVDDVLLPVEEPGGDLVLRRVLDDGDDALELVGVEVAGALVEVDVGLLADEIGVATTDTLDLCQGVHDLALAVDIGVEEAEDVLELLVLLGEHERHLWSSGWVAASTSYAYPFSMIRCT